MNQITWIFIGIIAMSVTGVTLRATIDDILGGLAGAIVWGYWALSATNVEIIRDGHPVVTESYPGLALFGAGLVGIHVIVMLVGAGKILDVRGGDYMGEQQGPPGP